MKIHRSFLYVKSILILFAIFLIWFINFYVRFAPMAQLLI